MTDNMEATSGGEQRDDRAMLQKLRREVEEQVSKAKSELERSIDMVRNGPEGMLLDDAVLDQPQSEPKGWQIPGPEDAGDVGVGAEGEGGEGSVRILVPYQWQFTDETDEIIPASQPEEAVDPPSVAYVIPHMHRWGFTPCIYGSTEYPCRLWVGDGEWVRNNQRCQWEGAQILPNNENGRQYIIATLKRKNGVNQNPTTRPDTVEVGALTNEGESAGKWPEDDLTLGGRNLIRVLGWIETEQSSEGEPRIVAYEQWVFEDLDDDGDVPDGNGEWDSDLGSVSATRSTLERREIKGQKHDLEWQIYGVGSLKTAGYQRGTQYVPIFQLDGLDSEGEATGFIDWWAPDGKYTWGELETSGRRTLTVGNTVDSASVMGLYGSGTAEPYTFPRLINLGAEGNPDGLDLDWTYPVLGWSETGGEGGGGEYVPFVDDEREFPYVESVTASVPDEPDDWIEIGKIFISENTSAINVENGRAKIDSRTSGTTVEGGVYVEKANFDFVFGHHMTSPDCSVDAEDGKTVSQWGGNYDHDARYVQPGGRHWEEGGPGPGTHMAVPGWPTIYYINSNPASFEGSYQEGGYVADDGYERIDLQGCQLRYGDTETPGGYSVDWWDGYLRDGDDDIYVKWMDQQLGSGSDPFVATLDWDECAFGTDLTNATPVVTGRWALSQLGEGSYSAWVPTLDWKDRYLTSGSDSALYGAITGAWQVGDATSLVLYKDQAGNTDFDEGALQVEGGIAVKKDSWFGGLIGFYKYGEYSWEVEPDSDGLNITPTGAGDPVAQFTEDVGCFFLNGIGAYESGILLLDNGRAAGWTVPAGTLSRGDPAYAGQTVSASYTQSELQATDDAVKALSQVVAALVTDLHANGVNAAGTGHHFLLDE